MLQQPQKLTKEQYQELARNWNQLPPQWNPDGVYGGIKEVKTGGRVFLYVIPALCSLLIALAVFLPWFSITFFGAGLSINGVGALSAPPGFVDSMQSLSKSPALTPGSTQSITPANQPYESWHGWFILVLVLTALVLCGFGVIMKSKTFSIGPLVAGVICLGLGGLDFWRTYNLIDDTYKQAGSLTQAQTALVNIQVGFGLYLLVAAGLAVVVGGIITLTLFDKQA